jgi:UDP-N-acetylmuramoylalanine--D-glutamate ligase
MSRDRGGKLSLAGKRAVVMGLGTRQGGAGVARFLVSRGADVTVTDLRGASELRPSLEAIGDLPIRLVLGEHRREDFEQADIVVRNPGVPADSPWLALARASGARIEMEMSLFFRACPAPIAGITGTKGKTTTSTLIASILRQSREDTVLAGNMGMSAVAALEQIREDTPVVIELSSWQLEGLAEHGLSPHIAVLTNISEDHLNRYASMADYVEAKRHIARFQRASDWFVVNRNDPLCWESRKVTAARVVPFGVLPDDEDGALLADCALIWRRAGMRETLIDVASLPLPGEHAMLNALAASAAALLAGASLDDVRRGLATAAPVPHRQELVAEIDGVRFVNDTTATAPAAALAALDTFAGQPVIVIAGGAGKGASLDAFARRLAGQADAVLLLAGDETPSLQRLLVEQRARRVLGPYDSMGRAVREAAALAEPGSVVLLSPGCASFGLFRDEFHRGEEFRACVRDLMSASRGGDA